MSSLALLEQMSTYSTEMVDAARANDWDRLTRLERQVASLRDRIGVEEALVHPSRPKRMSEDERNRRVALIRRILDDDKEVRTHTEPWMDSVRQLLSGGMTPRESMPQLVQQVMLAAPTTHFVTAGQAILYRGAGLDVVWPQMLAIAAIGATLFTTALARFRKTLSQMA